MTDPMSRVARLEREAEEAMAFARFAAWAAAEAAAARDAAAEEAAAEERRLAAWAWLEASAGRTWSTDVDDADTGGEVVRDQ